MMNKATIKLDKWLLFFMVVGLSLMLILRDVSGVSISKFIIFGYVVALMAIASYQTLVSMLCFILPLICGLPGTYIMPCALVLLVLKKGKIGITPLVGILLIFLLELVAAFWYPQTNVTDIINYVAFAAVMIFLIQDETKLDYEHCIKLYLLGTLVLCCVILIITFQKAPANWMELFAAGWFRIGGTAEEGEGMKLTLNANSLAYYSLVGIACCLLLIEKQKLIKKPIYIAAAVLLAVTGFLTVSRSWLLMGGICLLLYILGKLKTPKQFFGVFLILAAVTFIAVGYLEKNPEFLAAFETRFTDDTVESGGSRTYVFKEYMDIFLNNPRFMLLGTGVTQYLAVAGATESMHNGTQQILVCCGLFGFTVYMVLLIGPALKARKGRKIPMVYWLPLISIVAFVQTIQFLNPTMLILPYVIGIFAIRTGGQKNESISHNGGHRGGQPLGVETR